MHDIATYYMTLCVQYAKLSIGCIQILLSPICLRIRGAARPGSSQQILSDAAIVIRLSILPSNAHLYGSAHAGLLFTRL